MYDKPKFLRRYFWDIDFDKFDYKKHPIYVIERILEYGDVVAIRWMFKTFPRKQIIGALKETRKLTHKSANFWALIMGLKKENLKCLNKSFLAIRKQFWPY